MSKTGLPCDAVHWLIEDDSHSFWLYTPCGRPDRRSLRVAGAVQGLRSSTLVTNDLARSISVLGEELETHHSGDHCRDFRVQVEGTPRDLAPILRGDVYRIAGEAPRNALQHAQAAPTNTVSVSWPRAAAGKTCLRLAYTDGLKAVPFKDGT